MIKGIAGHKVKRDNDIQPIIAEARAECHAVSGL